MMPEARNRSALRGIGSSTSGPLIAVVQFWLLILPSRLWVICPSPVPDFESGKTNPSRQVARAGLMALIAICAPSLFSDSDAGRYLFRSSSARRPARSAIPVSGVLGGIRPRGFG